MEAVGRMPLSSRMLLAVSRRWLTPWRNRVAYRVLKSGPFSALFSRNGPGDDPEPTLAQIGFQRFLGAVLRHPDIFLCSFGRTLRVSITYRCNLSCKACYARGLLEQFPDDMKLEDCERLLGWAKEHGWPKIRFLGGEPSLHPGFKEMLEACYRLRLAVTLPTNNFFGQDVLAKLDHPCVKDIGVNYSTLALAGAGQKAAFRGNLEEMSRRDMPLSYSYIVSSKEEDPLEAELLADVGRYRPSYLRVSLELPAVEDSFESAELFRARERLFSRIRRIMRHCVREYVPFFVYRPIPLCLFSREQMEELRRCSRHVFFSRCPLSHAGPNGYGMMVTVNPDLSTFPCASVFVKGPEIFSLDTGRKRHAHHKEHVAPLLEAPLMKACETCPSHSRFIELLREDETTGDVPFAAAGACQGGCVNFRCRDADKGGCIWE